jgi:demethylmenaquinone methyltransferase/2-methoxy-6-polyprenyl-1,4-benzoquinol methylase
MNENNQETSRITRSKDKATTSYDKLVKWYDLIAGWAEKKPVELGLKKLDVKEGERVLEIGFGTGHSILSLAQLVGNTGKVYGIDISQQMLKIAQSRVNKAGLLDKVELTHGDAAKLPYQTNFFDAIFTSFTLELFDTPEIPIVLRECRRCLRSGGRISIVALSKDGKNSLILKLYEWLHRKFPNYIDCRPIFLRKCMENADFEILDATTTSMWSLPVEIILAKS